MRAALFGAVLLVSCAIVAAVTCSDPNCNNCDGAGSCNYCYQGYVVVNGYCELCPDGQTPATPSRCAHVIPGYYRANTPTAMTLIASCRKGRWGTTGQSSAGCSGPCMAGTYNEVTYGGGIRAFSTPFCRACDEGLWSSVDGADSCSGDNYCDQGTYSTGGDGNQTPSLTNAFTSSTCFPCPPGTADTVAPTAQRSAAATCGSCGAGKYSEGYATNGQGDFLCSDCPSGRYSGVTGTNSAQCQGGCAPGRWAQTTETARTTDQCSQVCAAGRYSTGGASGATDAAACGACPQGRYADTTGSQNDACVGVTPAGRYGTVAAAISTDFTIAGSTETTKCTSATWSPEAATTCYTCARGHYGVPVPTDDNGFTVNTCGGLCPVGSYSTNSNPADATTMAETTSCFTCAVGKYADVQGASSCNNCPSGRYGSVTGLTTPLCSGQCAAGRFGLPGSTADSCSGACLPGTYSTGGATNSSCIACAAGRFSASGGASSCAGLCAAGRYSLPGASSCSECPAGKFGAAAATSEACSGVCAAGTYSLAGASQCVNCPAGQYSAAGASACITCPVGHYTVGGSANPCAGTCNAGSYLSNGQCLQCPAGTYSAPGATACLDCAEGHWAAAGSAQCSSCLTSATVGRPACSACSKTTGLCTNCPANSEAVPTAAQGCRYCSAGFGSVVGGACAVCPTNQYTFGNGAPCQSCLTSSGPSCTACSNANGQCTACTSGNSVAIAFGGCIAVNPVDTTASVPVLSNQLAIDSAARGTLNQQQVLEKTSSREVLMVPVNVPASQTEDLTMTLDISGTPVVVTVPASALSGQGLRVVSFAVDVPPLFTSSSVNKPVSSSVTYYIGTPTSANTGSNTNPSMTRFRTASLVAPRVQTFTRGSEIRVMANDPTGTIRLSLLANTPVPANLMCGGAPMGTSATSYTAYAVPTAVGDGSYTCPLNPLYAVYSLVSVPNTSQIYATGTIAPRLMPQEYQDTNSDYEIGLGVGLGVGIPLLIAAIVMFVCFSHTLKQSAYVPTTTVPNGIVLQYQ